MNNFFIKFYFFVFFIFLLAETPKSLAGEIQINKEILKPDGTVEEVAWGHKLHLENNTQNNIVDSRVNLDFDTSNGEYKKGVHISIDKTLEKYIFYDLKAKIPFYRKDSKIEFLLFGHKIIPGSRSDIRKLRSVDPNKLGTKELFRYFAKSRIQAKYVLKNVLPDSKFDRDDVRAVYSFLQATNNLATQNYVEPDMVAERSSRWLSVACRNYENVCNSAVRKPNWQQVLAQYESSNQYWFEKIYDEMIKLKSFDYSAYCEMMISLQQNFNSMTDDEIIKINRRKITAQVAIATATCYVRSAWGVGFEDAFKGKNREKVLKRQILELENQLVSNSVRANEWPGLAANIKRAKEDLQNLIQY
jgi:hypothetical protein